MNLTERKDLEAVGYYSLDLLLQKLGKFQTHRHFFSFLQSIQIVVDLKQDISLCRFCFLVFLDHLE